MMTIPDSLTNVEYLGYGPHACYSDKKLSARIGHWKLKSNEMMERTIKPQDSANRYGTRYMTVSTENDLGFRITGDKTFEFSVSPYTPWELTNTAHDFELPVAEKTVVVIDYRQSGIGSNSCGPELAEKDRLSESNFSWNFEMELLGNSF